MTNFPSELSCKISKEIPILEVLPHAVASQGWCLCSEYLPEGFENVHRVSWNCYIVSLSDL